MSEPDRDIDPERLVFSRVDSVEQISLPYRREPGTQVGPEAVFQVGLVRLSYATMETARGIETVLSHVSGIAPIESIVYRRLTAGSIVGCYQSGGYEGALTGNYVTPDIGATLDELGIPPEWAKDKTHFALFEVTHDHYVLDTTAAPFKGTRGGARQYFITELEDRRHYRPIDFGRVHRCP